MGRGRISAQGPTEVRIFDENMDGQMYCDIFSGELKRSIGQIPGQRQNN